MAPGFILVLLTERDSSQSVSQSARIIHALVLCQTSLSFPVEQQGHDQRSQSHGGVSPASCVASRAATVPLRPVALAPPAVVGRLAAGRALHQGHLVGRGPLLRPVRAGAVAGPLAVVEQVAAVGVLLHPEELVLGVGEPDAQRHAAVCYGDVLLHPHLPGALGATLVAVEDVEEGRGGQVHGRHSHVVHWREGDTRREDRLRDKETTGLMGETLQ